MEEHKVEELWVVEEGKREKLWFVEEGKREELWVVYLSIFEVSRECSALRLVLCMFLD